MHSPDENSGLIALSLGTCLRRSNASVCRYGPRAYGFGRQSFDPAVVSQSKLRLVLQDPSMGVANKTQLRVGTEVPTCIGVASPGPEVCGSC